MGTLLTLERDHVVVGAGLSGLAAAIRLGGSTLLLSYGLGATAVSTGVLSYPEARDLQAEKWFLRIMAHTNCPYVHGKCMTESGAIREGLIQESMNFKDSPKMIMLNMGHNSLTFMEGSSYQEISRALESDDKAYKDLVGRLNDMEAESIILPPVLGIKRAAEIRRTIESATGKNVYEYATAPSVLGLRLVEALREKALSTVDMLELAKIERIGNGRVEGRMGTKGKREICVKCKHLLIATGGLLTGFGVSGDRLYEPLTGVTIAEDFEANLNTSFLSEHPLMYKGIGCTPIAIPGFDSVRAIGAAASGYGLYGALVGGYHAGGLR